VDVFFSEHGVNEGYTTEKSTLSKNHTFEEKCNILNSSRYTKL